MDAFNEEDFAVVSKWMMDEEGRNSNSTPCNNNDKFQGALGVVGLFSSSFLPLSCLAFFVSHAFPSSLYEHRLYGSFVVKLDGFLERTPL